LNVAIAEVLHTLGRRYRGQHTASSRRTPFAILVATILSARTLDETVGRAADRVLAEYQNPRSLAKAPLAGLRRLIYPVGFFRRKAVYLKTASAMLTAQFHSRVPTRQSELLRMPGVGRKTANVVLNYAFQKSAIAVDTHVHRIANRLGWIATGTPTASEQALESLLPRHVWRSVNDRFMKFGKDICRPIRPRCWRCPVRAHCRFLKKEPRPLG
jgi:endonuclease-3